jgi:hypothetical protein
MSVVSVVAIVRGAASVAAVWWKRASALASRRSSEAALQSVSVQARIAAELARSADSMDRLAAIENERTVRERADRAVRQPPKFGTRPDWMLNREDLLIGKVFNEGLSRAILDGVVLDDGCRNPLKHGCWRSSSPGDMYKCKDELLLPCEGVTVEFHWPGAEPTRTWPTITVRFSAVDSDYRGETVIKLNPVPPQGTYPAEWEGQIDSSRQVFDRKDSSAAAPDPPASL